MCADARSPPVTGTELPREDVPAAARARLLDAHADLVEAVCESADAVAAAAGAPTDGEAIVRPLTAALRETGALERFPAALADAVDATGRSLPATPVAAPPYVVVTSRGPVLRATLSDGRLVVSIRAFAVERPEPESGSGSGSAEARYVRASGDPAETVDVAFR